MTIQERMRIKAVAARTLLDDRSVRAFFERRHVHASTERLCREACAALGYEAPATIAARGSGSRGMLAQGVAR